MNRLNRGVFKIMAKMMPMCALALFISSTGFGLSLKTVLETPYYLNSATNVDFRRAEIKDFFAFERTKFPGTGALDELTESYLVSISGYSSLFCQRMIAVDLSLPVGKRWLHQTVDGATPPQKWAESTRDTVLSDYASSFWNRGLSQAESDILVAEFADVVRELPNDASSNEAVLNYFCPAFAASWAGVSK